MTILTAAESPQVEAQLNPLVQEQEDMLKARVDSIHSKITDLARNLESETIFDPTSEVQKANRLVKPLQTLRTQMPLEVKRTVGALVDQFPLACAKPTQTSNLQALLLAQTKDVDVEGFLQEEEAKVILEDKLQALKTHEEKVTDAALNYIRRPLSLISEFNVPNATLPRSSAHFIEETLNPTSTASKPKERSLGKGTFARVETHHLNETEVYAKKMPRSSRDPRKVEGFEKDAQALLRIPRSDHHIVNLEAIGDDGYYVELMQGGELGKNIQENLEDGKLLYNSVLSAAQSLNFLHQNGFLHLDIKPENFLVNEEGHVKISDFGFSTQPGTLTRVCGTPSYISPEMSELFSKKSKDFSVISEKNDVWSFGCMLFNFLSSNGKTTPLKMFTDLSFDRKFKEVPELLNELFEELQRENSGTSISKLFNFCSSESKLAKKDPTGVLRKAMFACLELDPAKRPTMQDVVRGLLTGTETG